MSHTFRSASWSLLRISTMRAPCCCVNSSMKPITSSTLSFSCLRSMSSSTITRFFKMAGTAKSAISLSAEKLLWEPSRTLEAAPQLFFALSHHDGFSSAFGIAL
ncbi:hypothetical protein C8245_05165 [Paracidovorax avenae]|nr:hypothetical protein C8245_05165 [Paracidovorax avenae]